MVCLGLPLRHGTDRGEIKKSFDFFSGKLVGVGLVVVPLRPVRRGGVVAEKIFSEKLVGVGLVVVPLRPVRRERVVAEKDFLIYFRKSLVVW